MGWNENNFAGGNSVRADCKPCWQGDGNHASSKVIIIADLQSIPRNEGSAMQSTSSSKEASAPPPPPQKKEIKTQLPSTHWQAWQKNNRITVSWI